jgi:hypothetical protein
MNIMHNKMLQNCASSQNRYYNKYIPPEYENMTTLSFHTQFGNEIIEITGTLLN